MRGQVKSALRYPFIRARPMAIAHYHHQPFVIPAFARCKRFQRRIAWTRKCLMAFRLHGFGAGRTLLAASGSGRRSRFRAITHTHGGKDAWDRFKLRLRSRANHLQGDAGAFFAQLALSDAQRRSASSQGLTLVAQTVANSFARKESITCAKASSAAITYCEPDQRRVFTPVCCR